MLGSQLLSNLRDCLCCEADTNMYAAGRDKPSAFFYIEASPEGKPLLCSACFVLRVLYRPGFSRVCCCGLQLLHGGEIMLATTPVLQVGLCRDARLLLPCAAGTWEPA